MMKRRIVSKSDLLDLRRVGQAHLAVSLAITVAAGLLSACGLLGRDVHGERAQVREDRGSRMPMVEVCASAGDCKLFSQMVMGTDHLGKLGPDGSLDEARARDMLDRAFDYGINAFDTSPIYVNGIEAVLGRWMKEKKAVQPDLYSISKGGFPFDVGPGSYRSRLNGSVDEIVNNVSSELQHSYPQLNNEIDVYLMHRDDVDYHDYRKVERPQTPVETILRALSDPRIRKKYTWVGLSNWETPRVNEAMSVAEREVSLVRPVINSPYFSLFEMNDQEFTTHSGGVQVRHTDMMNPQFQPGVRIMTYSTLGGFNIIDRGWQAAKRHAQELDAQGDRYWGNVLESIFHEENEKRYFRALDFVNTFRDPEGRSYTLDQLLHAYVLAHPRSDMVAIGPLLPEHIDRTVASLRLAEHLRKNPQILEFLYSGEPLP